MHRKPAGAGHRWSVLRQLLPALAAVASGLLTGAMLFIGLSVTPWAQNLPPEEFNEWILSYGLAMQRVLLPMVSLSSLLALGALLVSRGYSAACRRRLLLAAACLVVTFAPAPGRIAPMGPAFAAPTVLSRRQETVVLGHEIGWHWLRVTLDLTAFLATLSALRLREKQRGEHAQRERMDRLKRFFSPQLAELIMRGGEDDPLLSHRCEVTVVFLDLRGFTAFAESTEPEEVMAVLHEYHAAIGPLVLRWGGTLERFTGDGMMIFFNDPVPVPNPSEHAVRMAVAMRARVETLQEGWQGRGIQLDVGVGIAQGYATLGAIGFDGRWDYGAIGTVTNTAARLCAEALPGQILVTTRVLTDVGDIAVVDAIGDLQLKGLSKPVPAFNVIGLRAPAGGVPERG
jgi:class 3 adenylate cyclase